MNMLKKIFTYAVGTIACRLIMYVLLPIYTSNFSVAIYGEASMSLSTANIITSLAYMEIWAAFLRFGYEERKEDFKPLLTSVISIVLILTPIYITISFITSAVLNLQYAIMMMIYGLSLVIFNIEQYLCRIKSRQTLYIISGVLSAALQLCLAFILLNCNALHSSSILYLPIIGNIAGSLLIFCFTIKDQAVDFSEVNVIKIKKLVHFSLPLSLNSIAFWGMTNIGSYIARARIGLEANGYISVANKFTALVLLAVSVYNLAWQETAFEHASDQDNEKLFTVEFRRFIDIMCAVTICAMIGIDVIFPYYIGEKYAISRMLLPIYLCGSFANSISTFIGVIYSVAKRNGILIYSTLIGCFISAISVVCLIDTLGVICVPISLFVGMSINTIFRLLLLRKYVCVILRVSVLHSVASLILLVMGIVIVYCSGTSWPKVAYGVFVIMYYLYKYRRTLINTFWKLRGLCKGVE